MKSLLKETGISMDFFYFSERKRVKSVENKNIRLCLKNKKKINDDLHKIDESLGEEYLMTKRNNDTSINPYKSNKYIENNRFGTVKDNSLNTKETLSSLKSDNFWKKPRELKSDNILDKTKRMLFKSSKDNSANIYSYKYENKSQIKNTNYDNLDYLRGFDDKNYKIQRKTYDNVVDEKFIFNYKKKNTEIGLSIRNQIKLRDEQYRREDNYFVSSYNKLYNKDYHLDYHFEQKYQSKNHYNYKHYP